MKIINGGRGIHQREIPGLEKLKELPDNWCAFTNLDLSLPGKGIREIDVIMVMEDRLLFVDLKDWAGPITSEEGNWLNRGRLMGTSPVRKIAEISRDHLSPLLKNSLNEQARKEGKSKGFGSPRIDCAVVLTRTSDRTGISPSEVSSVFSIDQFLRTVRNQSERNKCFGEVSAKYEDFTKKEWMDRFRRFFNAKGSIFQPGARRYGGFAAKNSESPTFVHRAEIFAEFDVEEDGVNASSGLLRRWDFSKADTRFQSEEGRAQIAGRERSVIAWLDDRNPRCGEAVFKPKVEDQDRGVAYWEVFERRRRMKRLQDFAETELTRLTAKERIELARQVLLSVSSFHDLQAAHMDVGLHSVWVEPPTTVRLSHLMAASLPEVKTLGDSRFQFLSSSPVPEELLEVAIEPLRKDVFSLGCVVHTLLFGKPPAGDPPEWNVSIDPDGVYSALHPWFEKCLDIEQGKRFGNASEMLSAFNAAVASTLSDKSIIEGLERHKALKSQRQVFQKYEETELIHEDDRVLIWRSESDGVNRLVKLWKAAALGDLTKERARILSFLDKARSLVESPLPGIACMIDVHWTGDAIVLVQEYAEGESLSTVLKNSSGKLSKNSALELIDGLAEAVDNLHARSFSHGDVKPDNIVLKATGEGDGLMPTLIDVMDFSCGEDGERISRAYVPVSGGRYERDRYAVTIIVENVLGACCEPIPSVTEIIGAIKECRLGPPANGTLLPLREAIARVRNPKQADTTETYRVSIQGATSGEMLPDEGRYWLSKHGPNVRIRGATEELFVNLDADGRPVRARRSSISQGAVQRLRLHEKISFSGEIIVEGTAFGLSAVFEIMNRPDVAKALKEDSVEAVSEGDAEIEVVVTEAKEDELSEKISKESTGTVGVDVPLLWRRSIEIESELRVEVVAQGESSFRPQSSVHVVPVQITSGDIDFDRDDVVAVERLDSRNYWAKIGFLDVEKSTSSFLQIRSWIERGRGPVVLEGDRLRFQSRFENTSRQRREEAIGRILRRTSAATGLLDVFSPFSGIRPDRIERSIDEVELNERYGLNPSQIDGFKGILECRPVGLLQGPPGTGKTRFIGSLVHYALTRGIARNVLVASQSHEAVNNAAEAILKLFGADRDSLSMIRVGKEGSVSETLRGYHVATVERAYKDRFAATRESRMGVVARALGVGEHECEAVIYFEEAVSPVLARISELAGQDEESVRVDALKLTIEQLLLARGIDCNLAESEATEIEEEVSALYFSKLPSSQASRIERLRHVADLVRDIVGGVSTWQRSFETFLAGTRQVVAGTCVGLGRESLGLMKTAFDLVIVDEAARCTPSELAVPIQAGKWVVLVGDHAQLEPLHPADVVEMLAEEMAIPRHEIVKSDFERVFESAYGRDAGFTLKKQYRMLPPIGRLVSGAFYERGLQHGREKPEIPEHVLPTVLATPLVWVSTDSSGAGAYQRPGSSRPGSLQNPVEADLIVSLLRQWSEHEPLLDWIGARPDGEQIIGVICAYASQRDLIWKKLRSENLSEAFRRIIKVDTIDSYQGKENLIVLLSLVRNNSDGPKDAGAPTIAPGFMGRKNRINVALSRAMDRLVIVGAKGRWREGTPLGLVSSGFDEESKTGGAAIIDSVEVLDAARGGKKTKSKKNAPSKEREAGDE